MPECDVVELYLVNKSFEKIAVLDKYNSLIWTDRYNDLGDCEIVLSDYSLIDIIKKDYYLELDESDTLMIIDSIEGNSDLEEGRDMTITGHSPEKILTRRVVWDPVTYSGPVQGLVRTLMTENVIAPVMEARRIPNFGFIYNPDLEKSYSVSVSDLLGDELYDAIKSSCDLHDLGFRVFFNGYDGFGLKLYKGTDRSESQSINPIVTLSPKLENLKNVSFVNSNSEFKNVVYAVADNSEDVVDTMPDQEPEGLRITASVGDAAGMDRRELYLSVDLSERYAFSKQDYVTQQGRAALKEYSDKILYSGEYQETDTFQLNRDFFLGDIVQMGDEFGNKFRSRVTEVIYSEDESGYKIYPTLTSV